MKTKSLRLNLVQWEYFVNYRSNKKANEYRPDAKNSLQLASDETFSCQVFLIIYSLVKRIIFDQQIMSFPCVSLSVTY